VSPPISESGSTSASKRRRWLLPAFVTLVVVLGADYAAHRVRLSRLYALSLPSFARMDEQAHAGRVPAELFADVGTLRDEWFARWTARPSAHPGVLRIIAIGDSFTFGEEVERQLAYPELLEQRLRDSGFADVEVVNLGMSWHGIGQASRIADWAETRLQPDVVLVGPSITHLERDQTFNHGLPSRSRYFHGRYVLDGDDLRWLAPIGDGAEDRFNAYYRFVPSFRYLRYDRHAPELLMAPLPLDRELRNPFYYSALSPDDEGDALYARILKRLRAQRATMLVDFEASRLDTARAANIPALLAPALHGIFYQRPGWHLTATGNHVVAGLFFDLLTGATPVVDLITLSRVEPTATAHPGALPRLGQWHALELHAGGKLAGVLVNPDDDAEPIDLRPSAALLFLCAEGAALPDCRGLLLAEPLGTPVELEHNGVRRPLDVTWLAPEVPLARVTVDMQLDGTLLAGGRRVARLGSGVRATEHARRADLFASASTDLHALSGEGPVELMMSGDQPRRIVVGKFARRSQAVTPSVVTGPRIVKDAQARTVLVQ
jgi:hypothetical protein